MNEPASAAQCFEANAIAHARLTVQRIEEDRIAAAIMEDSIATKAVPDPRYSLERFKERLRNEDAMKDTEMPLTHIDDLRRVAAEQVVQMQKDNESLVDENARLRRGLSVLTKRIEELEAEIDTMRSELLPTEPFIDVPDQRIRDLEAELQQVKRNDEEVRSAVRMREQYEEQRRTCMYLQERFSEIAHTLKRFYFAEHSLSSLQPIIALCFELNPELVEQKR